MAKTPPDTIPIINKAAVVAAITRKLGEGAGELPPGEHVVRCRVVLDLDCVVSQAEPTSAQPAYRSDLVGAMAALARRLKVEPAQFNRLVTHALNNPAPEGDMYRSMADAVAKSVKDTWQAAQPRLPRAGACKVTGSIDLDFGDSDTPSRRAS